MLAIESGCFIWAEAGAKVLDYLKLFYSWIGAEHPKSSVALAGLVGALAFAGFWYAVGLQYRRDGLSARAPSVSDGREKERPALAGEVTAVHVVPEQGHPELSRVYVALFVINRGVQTALTAWAVDVEVPGRRVEISERGLREWSAPASLGLHGQNLLAVDRIIPTGGKCSGWLAFGIPTRGLVDGDIRPTGSLIERIVVHFGDVHGNRFSVASNGSR